MTPSDAKLAARMGEALEARRTGDIPGAIVLLTRLIEDYPDYAEAWNQRATMFYLINDFEASLADIEIVLQHEPRHFGALSGRAMIFLQQGKRALAVKAMAAALELHPFLHERQLFPELLQDVTRI
jgi:tetratricopeptide (TPR) repeat protein